MLLGPTWVIEHLTNLRGKSGNTTCGRVWAHRVRTEKPTLTLVCDSCHSEIPETFECPNRLRLVWQTMRKHQFDWGQHLCPKCSAVQAQQKMKKIRNNPEWRSKFAETVASGMSKMSPEERQQWRTNSRASLIQYYAETSEEKRRQGVVKQWQTMTQETKDARAKKIRKWSKSFWAAMTPEQRNLHVSKMIKGLSRSKISDEFRQTLVGFGLYYGFRSEQTVSGFVVDECNEELKVVIEFYGDYYHCNPRNPKFADPEYYNPTLRMKASQKWESDRRRFAAIRKKGYQVLVVWENDWRKSPATEIARVQMFLSGARKKSGSSPPSSE